MINLDILLITMGLIMSSVVLSCFYFSLFSSLLRSASDSLAKLTGQPRAVARAALDALNEEREVISFHFIFFP